MPRRIFLDLDGTLIDPRQRLHALFRELAPESTLSFDEYWHRKREGMTQRQMLQQLLGYSEAQIQTFHCNWMDKVEEPDRLKLDIPFPGIDAFIFRIRERFSIYLITARQHPDRLAVQLAKLGWLDLFTDVLATGQRQSKAEMIRSRCLFGPGDILVGDTGEDILAGKALGIGTIAVTSGALSESALREYHPDCIVPTVVALLDDEMPCRQSGAALS